MRDVEILALLVVVTGMCPRFAAMFLKIPAPLMGGVYIVTLGRPDLLTKRRWTYYTGLQVIVMRAFSSCRYVLGGRFFLPSIC